MNTDELVEKMRQVLGDALVKQMGIGYYYVTAETARAALAVVPLPEWRPIETAPKDGALDRQRNRGLHANRSQGILNVGYRVLSGRLYQPTP